MSLKTPPLISSSRLSKFILKKKKKAKENPFRALRKKDSVEKKRLRNPPAHFLGANSNQGLGKIMIESTLIETIQLYARFLYTLELSSKNEHGLLSNIKVCCNRSSTHSSWKSYFDIIFVAYDGNTIKPKNDIYDFNVTGEYIQRGKGYNHIVMFEKECGLKNEHQFCPTQVCTNVAAFTIFFLVICCGHFDVWFCVCIFDSCYNRKIKKCIESKEEQIKSFRSDISCISRKVSKIDSCATDLSYMPSKALTTYEVGGISLKSMADVESEEKKHLIVDDEQSARKMKLISTNEKDTISFITTGEGTINYSVDFQHTNRSFNHLTSYRHLVHQISRTDEMTKSETTESSHDVCPDTTTRIVDARKRHHTDFSTILPSNKIQKVAESDLESMCDLCDEHDLNSLQSSISSLSSGCKEVMHINRKTMDFNFCNERKLKEMLTDGRNQVRPTNPMATVFNFIGEGEQEKLYDSKKCFEFVIHAESPISPLSDVTISPTITDSSNIATVNLSHPPAFTKKINHSNVLNEYFTNGIFPQISTIEHCSDDLRQQQIQCVNNL